MLAGANLGVLVVVGGGANTQRLKPLPNGNAGEFGAIRIREGHTLVDQLDQLVGDPHIHQFCVFGFDRSAIHIAGYILRVTE